MRTAVASVTVLCGVELVCTVAMVAQQGNRTPCSRGLLYRGMDLSGAVHIPLCYMRACVVEMVPFLRFCAL